MPPTMGAETNHPFATSTAAQQNGQKAGNNDGHSHDLGANALQSAFSNRRAGN
jgi:hypothetical protein